jgi:hypothetical protein
MKTTVGILIGLGATVLVGCASPAVSVAVKPLRGQATAQLDADSTACERQVKGQDKADTAYAACMIARGYKATVDLPLFSPIGGGKAIYVEVNRRAPTNAYQSIAQTIRNCREQATAERDRRTSGTDKAFSILVHPGFTDMHGAEVVQQTFAVCLGDEYEVVRWEPLR